MPLLEIANANAKPSFQYPLCSIRTQKRFHYKIAPISFAFGNELRFPCAWKSLDKLKKLKLNVGCVELRRGRLLIKVVATLEPKRLASSDDKCMTSKDSELGRNSSQLGVWHESSKESKEPDEKEKLRRMRISKANKGGTSWNKGKKHSPETLQKIRERTRLAMQNPKVKMKLANFGHAQSAETRLKIGAGVKKGWEMKREKKMVQETCYFEWQNLIAEASRQGYVGQQELQWNSYKVLDDQLTLEWQESINERKRVPKVQGSRNAPKSLEQRRKIAEAISSKWADPEYRERVCSALAKYYGTEVGAERKPRRRSSDGTQSTRRNPIKKRSTDTIISFEGETKILNRMKRSKSPVYKDPLVSSKLEMIKNIRAQRAAAETKLTEAIERARLLIAEAEKAAKVLEVAATKSPIAQASLIETRKLIAEAMQSLESIDTQQITESNDSSKALSDIDEGKGAAFEAPIQSDIGQVNGHRTLLASDYKFSDDFHGVSLQHLLNGDPKKLHLTTTNGCASFPLGPDSWISESGSTNEPREALQDQSIKSKTDSSTVEEQIQSLEDVKPSRSLNVTKKWVRGRLVEVVDET